MTWEEKFAALNALAPARLLMRCPGDWYVDQNVEIKRGGMLDGSYRNGRTPEEAVEEHWQKLTKIAPTDYLVFNASGKDRRAYRWHVCFWEEVRE